MRPRDRVEVVGPMGWSADLPVAPTAPSFNGWAILGYLVLIPGARSYPKPVSLGAWDTFDPIEPEFVL